VVDLLIKIGDTTMPTESNEPTLTPRLSAFMGSLAVTGLVLFAGLIVALHLLRTDISPIKYTLSEYSTGEYSALMVAAFFVLSGSILAFAIGLYGTFPPSARPQRAFWLLGICAAGLALAGIFPTDHKDDPITLTGIVHLVAADGGILCGLIGIVLIVRRMPNLPHWQAFYHQSMRLTVVVVGAFGMWFVGSALGLNGLGQRIFALTAIAWLVYAAVNVYRIARSLVKN
jgi:hypothetical protein